MDRETRYRAVCFDMDGTLLNTKVDTERMTSAIFDVFEEYGVPQEAMDRAGGYKTGVDKCYAWLMNNRDQATLEGLGRAIKKAVVEIEMERVDETVPYHGAREMLERVRSRGLLTGILTRGTRVYTEAALKRAGVADLLDAVVSRDDYPETEAKPDPIAMRHLADRLGVRTDEILFAGDHKFDWMCARDSYAKFVGVTTGTYSKEDWVELDPEMDVADTVADVDRFL